MSLTPVLKPSEVTAHEAVEAVVEPPVVHFLSSRVCVTF